MDNQELLGGEENDLIGSLDWSLSSGESSSGSESETDDRSGEVGSSLPPSINEDIHRRRPQDSGRCTVLWTTAVRRCASRPGAGLLLFELRESSSGSDSSVVDPLPQRRGS